MTNVEHLSGLVNNLSELELQTFVEGISNHVHKDKLTHLFDAISSDKIDDLEYELKETEGKLEEARDECDALKDKLTDVEEAMPIRFEDFTEEHYNELVKALK